MIGLKAYFVFLGLTQWWAIVAPPVSGMEDYVFEYHVQKTFCAMIKKTSVSVYRRENLEKDCVAKVQAFDSRICIVQPYNLDRPIESSCLDIKAVERQTRIRLQMVVAIPEQQQLQRQKQVSNVDDGSGDNNNGNVPSDSEWRLDQSMSDNDRKETRRLSSSVSPSTSSEPSTRTTGTTTARTATTTTPSASSSLMGDSVASEPELPEFEPQSVMSEPVLSQPAESTESPESQSESVELQGLVASSPASSSLSSASSLVTPTDDEQRQAGNGNDNGDSNNLDEANGNDDDSNNDDKMSGVGKVWLDAMWARVGSATGGKVHHSSNNKAATSGLEDLEKSIRISSDRLQVLRRQTREAKKSQIASAGREFESPTVCEKTLNDVLDLSANLVADVGAHMNKMSALLRDLEFQLKQVQHVVNDTSSRLGYSNEPHLPDLKSSPPTTGRFFLWTWFLNLGLGTVPANSADYHPQNWTQLTEYIAAMFGFGHIGSVIEAYIGHRLGKSWNIRTTGSMRVPML